MLTIGSTFGRKDRDMTTKEKKTVLVRRSFPEQSHSGSSFDVYFFFSNVNLLLRLSIFFPPDTAMPSGPENCSSVPAEHIMPTARLVLPQNDCCVSTLDGDDVRRLPRLSAERRDTRKTQPTRADSDDPLVPFTEWPPSMSPRPASQAVRGRGRGKSMHVCEDGVEDRKKTGWFL